MNELDTLVQQAQISLPFVILRPELENAKAQFLGKSGRISDMMKGLSQLDLEAKKSQGALINAAKQSIEQALSGERQALADAELNKQLQAEKLDVTLPSGLRSQGGLHPVSLSLERIELIFASMGFSVAQGPEIETDWFNFTALNTPEDHPARSHARHLLCRRRSFVAHAYQSYANTPCHGACAKRTKNALEAGNGMPEIRVIAPGRTYRVDSDATHSPMFHQCEGLWIGENISFKDLKVVFTDFCKTFFENDALVLAFSTQFFPFHRAQCGDRHPISQWPFGRTLVRSGRFRAGTPQCGSQHGLRPRALLRFCFWYGA
jgi:phenylalanyl-tRNA synthetase alpha chain